MHLAYLNAGLQTGYLNPIVGAISDAGAACCDIADSPKIDDIPYDFVRKRLSVGVQRPGPRLLISKRAFAQILELCTHAEMGEQRFALSPDSTWVASHPASPQTHLDLQARFLAMSEKGLRVLGLAVTPCEADRISKADERDMTFVGFLVFSDPPKREARDTIAQLRELGVALKVITGDNRAVAASISAQVGIESPEIVTGEEIRTLSEMALRQREKLFQTGWFIESTLTGLVILLVIRTQRQLIYSKPGRMFLIAELFVAVMTLAIPFSPMGDLLGFVRPPSQLLLITVVITFLYGLGMEIVKYGFYRFLAK